jgi:hypothetical protein
MWRWAWTAGVFGLFFVVIGAALDGAPRADGELPLIEPGAEPIKERVALPDIDQVVPRSSVLNLLAEGDDPEAAAPEAVAALQERLAADTAREREAARVERALESASADTSDPPGGTDGDAGEGPFATVPQPDRRPTTAREQSAAGGEDADEQATGEATSTREVAARGSGGAFRIQLAAVPPGEEQATFARLERRFGDALAGLAPRFQAISTDAGVLVRVQVAGFASEAAAADQCERIRAAGGDCFVVAGSG